MWLGLYPHPTAPHVLQAPPSTFRGPPHRSEATQTPSASAQPSSGGEHGPLKRTTPFVSHCPGRHQAPPPRYYWIMCLPLSRVCLWRRRDHSPARPARFLKGTAPFLLHLWLTGTPQHAGGGGWRNNGVPIPVSLHLKPASPQCKTFLCLFSPRIPAVILVFPM